MRRLRRVAFETKISAAAVRWRFTTIGREWITGIERGRIHGIGRKTAAMPASTGGREMEVIINAGRGRVRLIANERVESAENGGANAGRFSGAHGPAQGIIG